MVMKKIVFFICIIYGTAAAYLASLFYAESLAYIPPKAQKADISQIAGKDPASLTEKDYEFIFSQTGLGKAAVNSLKDLGELISYQESYFTAAEFDCKANSPVSCEERITGKPIKLAPLENGDILVTNCSHVLSWRNGHAAIVADAEKGVTVEAVVIGKNSKTQDISKWTKYPNLTVLRLKGVSAENRAKIAMFAAKNLNNVPYNVFIGLYPQKYCVPDKISGTQCAHLIWLSYAAFGFDIDSDRGLIVTPEDIRGSDLFEVVQTYGRG